MFLGSNPGFGSSKVSKLKVKSDIKSQDLCIKTFSKTFKFIKPYASRKSSAPPDRVVHMHVWLFVEACFHS